jgi:hypothetical protein
VRPVAWLDRPVAWQGWSVLPAYNAEHPGNANRHSNLARLHLETGAAKICPQASGEDVRLQSRLLLIGYLPGNGKQQPKLLHAGATVTELEPFPSDPSQRPLWRVAIEGTAPSDGSPAFDSQGRVIGVLSTLGNREGELPVIVPLSRLSAL